MSERFIPLSCPNCGAKLEIYDDMTRFACGHCGTEVMTERRGGAVMLKAVTEAIRKVQVGTDKTAAELALVRLATELRAAESTLVAIQKEFVQPLITPESKREGRIGIFIAIGSFVGLLTVLVVVVPAIAAYSGERAARYFLPVLLPTLVILAIAVPAYGIYKALNGPAHRAGEAAGQSAHNRRVQVASQIVLKLRARTEEARRIANS